MENVKIYSKSFKTIYFKNYCTDFMFLVVMVCVTYKSTILSLILVNFILVLMKIIIGTSKPYIFYTYISFLTMFIFLIYAFHINLKNEKCQSIINLS